MREPSFWWRHAGAASAALSPLAAIYDAVATRRMRRSGMHAGVPVICIGDPTVGGAGKTPTAIAVARVLQAGGRRPFFLTRGYGGTVAGPVVVSSNHHARDVGDEPLLLARVATTVVGRDRVAGAAIAIAQGADVVVLDDGFQNPALHKDLSLLVVDGHRGIGNACTVPAGPLRASLSAQVERAHGLVVIGDMTPLVDPVLAAARACGVPLWTGRLAADPGAVATLKGRTVIAFAGIGHPQKFFVTLARAGIDAVETIAFADHHAYVPADAADLLRRADRAGAALVTTEKDHVRLSGHPDLSELAHRSATVPVSLAFDDPDAIRTAVLAVRRPALGDRDAVEA
jgi:tetraacyldisaccharide 4'-kinase